MFDISIFLHLFLPALPTQFFSSFLFNFPLLTFSFYFALYFQWLFPVSNSYIKISGAPLFYNSLACAITTCNHCSAYSVAWMDLFPNFVLLEISQFLTIHVTYLHIHGYYDTGTKHQHPSNTTSHITWHTCLMFLTWHGFTMKLSTLHGQLNTPCTSVCIHMHACAQTHTTTIHPQKKKKGKKKRKEQKGNHEEKQTQVKKNIHFKIRHPWSIVQF